MNNEFWLDRRVRLIEKAEQRNALKTKQKTKKFRIQRKIEQEKELKRNYYERSTIYKNK